MILRWICGGTVKGPEPARSTILLRSPTYNQTEECLLQSLVRNGQLAQKPRMADRSSSQW